VDLGGTKILVGLLNKDFQVLATEKAKVQPKKAKNISSKRSRKAFKMSLRKPKSNPIKCSGLGLAAPALLPPRGKSPVFSQHLLFEKLSARQKISQTFDLPVALGNDVNTGPLREHQFGAAAGYSHVVGIFLGTGIGGALILDGKLYAGASGAAGEIGHIFMDSSGPLCGCGKRGCLEALAGRVAIASEAAVLAAKQKAPNLFDAVGTELSKIKSGTLAKAIAAGDESIKELMEQKARLIGIAMANLVNILNPELFVLGGGMMEAMGSWILPEAKKTMRQYAMPGMVKKVKVVAAKLKDHAIVQRRGQTRGR